MPISLAGSLIPGDHEFYEFVVEITESSSTSISPVRYNPQYFQIHSTVRPNPHLKIYCVQIHSTFKFTAPPIGRMFKFTTVRTKPRHVQRHGAFKCAVRSYYGTLKIWGSYHPSCDKPE